MHELPPRNDIPLREWAVPFAAAISADPSLYGISPADAAQFQECLEAYSSALSIATTPSTRTKPNVSGKNSAKQILRAQAARLIRIIGATSTLSDTQRVDMGLRPRLISPPALPAPDTAPFLSIDSSGLLRIRDFGSPRRGRPAGALGAVVLTCLLPATAPPPQSADEARFAILATRPKVQLPLPPGADTQKLYVFARWYNQRGAVGPVSKRVCTTIAG